MDPNVFSPNRPSQTIDRGAGAAAAVLTAASTAAAAAGVLFSLAPRDNKVKLALHHQSRLFSKGARHSVDCKKQKGRGWGNTETSKRDDEVVLLHPGNVNTEARHQGLCIHPASFFLCAQTEV